MNILIITPSFPDYSKNDFAGKFVLLEALAYAQNGANVTVLTPHQPGAKKIEFLKPNLKIIRFRYFYPENFQILKKPNTPLYDPSSILGFLQIPFLILFFFLNIFKHSKSASIIHCQWTFTAFLALPSKWILNKKIIVTARGSDIRLIPVLINKFIHRQVSAAIDCYGPQSWNKAYKNKYPSNYIKLPIISLKKDVNTMPDDMAIHISEIRKPFIIIYLGRFHELKIKLHGLPLFTLIECAAELKAKGKSVQIFYLGGGDMKIINQMTQSVKKNNVGNIVHLLGVKSNVEKYIPFCDLGIGGAAFDHGSLDFSFFNKPQILVDNEDNYNTPWKDKINSLFVKPDSVKSLSEAIEYSIDNKKKSQLIATKANELTSSLVVDTEIGGNLYIKALRDVLKGKL